MSKRMHSHTAAPRMPLPRQQSALDTTSLWQPWPPATALSTTTIALFYHRVQFCLDSKIYRRKYPPCCRYPSFLTTRCEISLVERRLRAKNGPMLPTVSIKHQFVTNCPSNYYGYYADDMCEYCCLGNLCNRDQSPSWVKTDCSRLQSSAATVAMGTAWVAMVTVTSWRLIMAAM